MSQPSSLARRLADLFARLAVDNSWSEVESTAQSLANALRVRGGPVDEHSALGKTMLPKTLTSLLKAALDESKIPDDFRSPAVLELLRVGANLCMDHNDNRGYLLDAGYVETVISLLEVYSDSMPNVPVRQPFPLPTNHLKIVKTAVGVVLNSSLGYSPVQSKLNSLDASVTLLRLSSSLYPPGAWLSTADDIPFTQQAEDWTLRSNICEWAWRAIFGLQDNAPDQQPSFAATSIPFLVLPLQSFILPYPIPSGPVFNDPSLRHSLTTTDVEVLEEVCESLESLCLDAEDVRLALARGMSVSEEGLDQPCLSVMMDFVESGEYPPHWSYEPPPQVEKWKQTFALCKTAIVKAAVEVAGDENNTDVLWDFADNDAGFVARMVRWIRANAKAQGSEVRDDLVICSTLCLGNLIRKENHSQALVRSPVSLIPDLISFLRPEVDLKVKHGVIGLLKHLSQAPSNRQSIGEAGTIPRLAACLVFSDKADIAEVVQMSAIGVAKHLCTGNVPNAMAVVSPVSGQDPSTSCLSQILALVQRSDFVSVKSEGTRVLVNAIKSLYSSTGNVQDPARREATKVVTNPTCAMVLAQLLARSGKFPVLIHEAVLSLFLLSLQFNGAIMVLDALMQQLPTEMPQASHALSESSSSQTSPITPVVAPTTALDMCVTILKNHEGRFPAELRVNLCELLGQLGKVNQNAKTDRTVEVERLKSATRAVLEATKSSENMVLGAAARKALDTWA